MHKRRVTPKSVKKATSDYTPPRGKKRYLERWGRHKDGPSNNSACYQCGETPTTMSRKKHGMDCGIYFHWCEEASAWFCSEEHLRKGKAFNDASIMCRDEEVSKVKDEDRATDVVSCAECGADCVRELTPCYRNPDNAEEMVPFCTFFCVNRFNVAHQNALDGQGLEKAHQMGWVTADGKFDWKKVADGLKVLASAKE